VLHLEVSQVVSADLETVFSAYTNFEAMPEWSKRLGRVKVTKREGDTVYLESETVSSKGSRRKMVGKVRLIPPARVTSNSETRFTRTTRTVVFERVEDIGTKVTATLDLEVKGLWGLVFTPRATKDEGEASAREELSRFAKHVEAMQ